MSDFLKQITDAGIVGAGGAGFPTHVKLNTKAEYVLVNGAECEPLLRVDQILMANETDKILEALSLTVKQVGAKEGVITLKEKYKDAIKKLNEKIGGYGNLRIHLLRNIYPAGDEHYIVYDVTGRIVPEGGIPLNVGCVVVNVETLLNIYNAVQGIPLTEKYMTICGEVRNPMTIKVPLGISVREVIEIAGGTTLTEYKVIDGGPMMGKILNSIDTPVKKTSKGYIVLPKNHGLITSKEKDIATELKETKTACCHCDLCTDVCTRYLLGHKLHPSKIMRIASYGSMGDHNATLDEAFLCCECGLCESACIMNLQPWKVNIYLKQKLTEQGVTNSNHRTELSAHPFLDVRGFPVKKLVFRLDLYKYDVESPFTEVDFRPKEVNILCRQNIGAPAKAVVSDGDFVRKGDLVYGQDGNNMAVNMHATIDGKVKVTGSRIIITSQKEEN
ncbi:MAG TPA: 4Fe-4S dicluster domain-containing protein [Proteiniclasticum sp.]|nr:4Fe-4S dicluster domain-containing protein [Proteiniclasticum sp.]